MKNAELSSLEIELDSLHKELELLRSRYAQGRVHELAYVAMREALSNRLDKIRARASQLDRQEKFA